MRIIQAEMQHAEEAAKLFNDYRQFYNQDNNLEGCIQFLTERIEKKESVIFLAYPSAHEQASGFIQLYPSYTSVGLGRIWIINDLYVAENARRKGLGESLMMQARKFAEENGAKRLVLETQISNNGAQLLYESLFYKKDTENYHYELELER